MGGLGELLKGHPLASKRRILSNGYAVKLRSGAGAPAQGRDLLAADQFLDAIGDVAALLFILVRTDAHQIAGGDAPRGSEQREFAKGFTGFELEAAGIDRH